jgi:hypothetical protein
MKEVYIVYKSDVWHSHANRDLLGVGSSLEAAIKICKEQAKSEKKKISKDQLFNLNNIKQTQGYDGIGEFLLVHLDLDKLI